MFGGNYRFVLALTVVSLLGAGCGQPQPVPVPVNPNTVGYGYSVGNCGGASGTPVDPSNPTSSANFYASSGSGSLTLNIGTTQQPNLSAPVVNVVASGNLVNPDISTMMSQMPGMPAQPQYCVSSSGLSPGWFSNGSISLVLQGPMGGQAINGQAPTIQVSIQGTLISGRIQGTMQVTVWAGTMYAQQLPAYQLQ